MPDTGPPDRDPAGAPDEGGDRRGRGSARSPRSDRAPRGGTPGGRQGRGQSPSRGRGEGRRDDRRDSRDRGVRGRDSESAGPERRGARGPDDRRRGGPKRDDRRQGGGPPGTGRERDPRASSSSSAGARDLRGSRDRRDTRDRRDPRDQGAREAAPPVPEDVTGRELDREVRAELRSLPKGLADRVAGHLVMSGRLVDEDPATALRHAREARRLAPRVATVREASGLAAYLAGEYAEALQDLRAVRRITGSSEHLPVMADCERGLGRPDRALTLARGEEAGRLDTATRVEMLIVEAGARRDLGQRDAAVLTLQGAPLQSGRRADWWPRLAYAYADALLDAGRREDAHAWFARAADADEQGETDAQDRLAEMDGIVFLEPEPGSEDGPEPGHGSAESGAESAPSEVPGASPDDDAAR